MSLILFRTHTHTHTHTYGHAHTRTCQVEYKGEKKVFAPEEISSMVLVKMKEVAESFLGKEVTLAPALTRTLILSLTLTLTLTLTLILTLS